MAVYTQIDNPELYMQVKLYTGDGSTQSITLDGDEDMQPDFVWIKNRTSAEGSGVFDVVRDVTKMLCSQNADGEDTDANSLTAFGSDGFSVGTNLRVNQDTNNIVAWNWKETADAGFDIVSYTGDGSNRTISHSLSAVPEVIIIKCISADARSWTSYHAPLGNGKHMTLNETDAEATASTSWNDTTPTTSVFSLGTSNNVNDDTETHIAYCFAPKQGFSAMGSYTGNGDADGTFIYTGFKPAFLIMKPTSTTGNWFIFDNKREGFNHQNDYLLPNDPIVEVTNERVDLLSNGFKFRTHNSGWNGDGVTYIYIAFAEAPFVNSNGVPCNAR